MSMHWAGLTSRFAVKQLTRKLCAVKRIHKKNAANNLISEIVDCMVMDYQVNLQFLECVLIEKIIVSV